MSRAVQSEEPRDCPTTTRTNDAGTEEPCPVEYSRWFCDLQLLWGQFYGLDY